MRIKKAQVGKSVAKKPASKDSVPSEMFPGKMIPKSAVHKGPYITKKAAPKKKMKDGGKSFPDLNKDGKITKADILVGRGVIKAKKGVKLKAQAGVALRSAQLKRVGRLAAKDADKAKEVGSRMVERATRRQRGKEFIKKNLSELMPKSKGGSNLKKQAAIAIAMKKAGKSPKKAMGGMKMGKCKYGC